MRNIFTFDFKDRTLSDGLFKGMIARSAEKHGLAATIGVEKQDLSRRYDVDTGKIDLTPDTVRASLHQQQKYFFGLRSRDMVIADLTFGMPLVRSAVVSIYENPEQVMKYLDSLAEEVRKLSHGSFQ